MYTNNEKERIIRLADFYKINTENKDLSIIEKEIDLEINTRQNQLINLHLIK